MREQVVAGVRVLRRLADGARQVVQADAAMVRLLDADGTHLQVVAVSGLPAEGLEGEALRTKG